MALMWVKVAAELLDSFLLTRVEFWEFFGLALHAGDLRGEMALEREQEAQMTYHFSKTVNMRFDDAVASAKEALKRHNFRVLTEIDMKDNFKKGLNIDFRPYLILGACNPQLTYRALQAEDKIGAMLPCNIVLQQHEDGRVEVSAVDPVASMQAIAHVVVDQVAREIRCHLQNVIDEVGNATDSGRCKERCVAQGGVPDAGARLARMANGG